jgi:hypothetical protein
MISRGLAGRRKTRSDTMKKLMIGLALVAVAATPALAESYHSRASNNSQASVVASDSYDKTGSGAYAAAPGASTNGMDPGVYQYGVYAGWDPDPSIRHQLQRIEAGQNVD